MKNWLTLFFAVCVAGVYSYAQQSQENKEFYTTDAIQDVKIRFMENNWMYLLDSLIINGEKMLIATVEINGQKFENAGVRYAASRSFTTGGKRNGLIIKLNLIDRSRNYQGLTSLKLSPAVRDPSMVREVLSFEIARSYMVAPRANYARVNVNGSPYGLFVNVEKISDSFLEDHFGSADGALFKANPPVKMNEPEGCKKNIYCNLEYDSLASCYVHNYEILSEYGWDELIKLTRVLKEEPGNIESVLNVDAALWMLAFNNVLVNLNSYSGAISENYFLYQDTFGRFYPVVWDLNLSFGSFKNTGHGSDLDLKGLQQLDPLLHENNPVKPLISQLLQNELYKKVYLSHVRTILYDWFISKKYLERAQELQKLIADEFAKDPNKFYTVEELNQSLENTIGKRSKIPGIEELMSKRSSFLKKHDDLTVVPPLFESNIVQSRQALEADKIDEFRIQTQVGKYAKKVKIFYRFEGEKEFREMTMMDDGKHFDETAGDNIFGAVIKPENGEDTLEYYFFAENAAAVNFDPTRYMFNPHKISLEQLNK